MNRKRFVLLALVLLFAFGVAVVLGAGTTGAFSATLPEENTADGNAPAVSVGQPGTVFRYVETFGETEVAYLADADHLYRPYGLGLDGADNLWVTEGEGSRAMNYGGDGSFLMSIGVAGLIGVADGSPLSQPVDTAVDNDGNIWVTDIGFARVVKFDPDGNYLLQLGVTGENGSDDAHFDWPIGVAFDSAGDIYVSDQNNHRVQVFDSSGVYSATLGVTGEAGSGNDHFNGPRHIAIDDDDALYVADTFNHRVQIFDAGHTYTATLGVSGEPGSDNAHFDAPRGVAVDASFIYVADSNNYRVQIFDRATYTYQDTLGGWGSGDYEFNWPTDVVVDSNGSLYVADYFNYRVQKFDSSLAYLHTFGTTGVPYLTDGYHYNGPFDVAADESGNIAIIEDWGRGQRLIILDASGAPQVTIGEAGVAGDDNDHFSDPSGVAFDADGNIYVADCANHRVQILDSNGDYLATLGSFGQGNNQFDCPRGVVVDGSGNIYVADATNQRIQIFDSSLTYSATLGVTGEPGADNGHFSWPQDVEVDTAGNIYVADLFNHRVQKFDSSHTWQMTLGVTGECGSDFNHFCEPYGVAVDAAGNIYVVEKFGPRVQVFDANGAYLTTIGGAWGSLSSQLREPYGIEVDAQGNVYVADTLNHRIQKFAPGVPDWQQVNINGFGERYAQGVTALEEFSGQFYAGTSTSWESGKGPQVYRSSDGVSWSAASEPGFGVYTDTVSTIIDLAVFDGQIYAGAGWGNIQGQAWRSPDGVTWEPVTTDGFGDGGNTAVTAFAVFNGMFYAGTYNGSGAQIWRSASGSAGDWTKVGADEPGTENTTHVTGFAVYQGSLYAAVESDPGDPAQVWRSTNGSAWDTVIADGFGDVNNRGTGGFAEFGGYLYLGTWNDVSGAQIWRSADGTSWEPVVGDGFGDTANFKVEMLVVFANGLYAEVNNWAGLNILYSSDGELWEPINPDGFGDSNNWATLWKNSTAKFQNQLYIGTWNSANGGEIWRYDLQEQMIYLPVIVR